MADAVQISRVAQRGVVRLTSWTRPPTPARSLVPPGLDGQVRRMSFAPGEWWMVSDSADGPELCESLRQHVEGLGIVVVDLSCALKVLRVEGSAAREVLEKGCGVDLHPSRFPERSATRTRFAQLAVILECTDPAPRFDLYVGRSYLGYLNSWLQDAAVEFHPGD